MTLPTGTSIPQSDPPRSRPETLPTMYDLPSEFPEESGLPDVFHDLQPQLLSRTLQLPNVSQEDYFTASDLNVYYDRLHPLWHKRPDWFLAMDVPILYEKRDLRLSYVVWQEGQSPRVVVEFLSPATEREDLGRFYTPADQAPGEPSPFDEDRSTPRKLAVYEQYLQVPHYLVYSRYTQKLRYFQWIEGEYVEQAVQATNPMIWFADLQVGLGLWEGVFEGVPAHWLRWCDGLGNWFLTDTEQERLAKEQERLAKEQERQRADRLAAKLRELGIDPDAV